MFIFVSELNYGIVTKTFEVVYLNKSLENWESVLRVSNLVIAIQVDTSNLHLIARSCGVHQIVEHDALLLPWDSARRDSAGCFLNSQFLVIAVNSRQLIECVRTVTLATNTHTGVVLCFSKTRVVSWSFQISADTSDEHFVVLRENA